VLFADPYLVAARLADLRAEAASDRLARASRSALRDPHGPTPPRSLADRLDPRSILALAAIQVSLASAATARRLDPCLADRASQRFNAFGR
jgi:hypothetical protein